MAFCISLPFELPINEPDSDTEAPPAVDSALPLPRLTVLRLPLIPAAFKMPLPVIPPLPPDAIMLPIPERMLPLIAPTRIKSAIVVCKLTPVPITLISGSTIPPVTASNKPAAL